MNGEQKAWLVFGVVLVIALCILFTTLVVTTARHNIVRDAARIEHGIREGLSGSCIVIIMDDGVDMQCHFDTDKYDNQCNNTAAAWLDDTYDRLRLDAKLDARVSRLAITIGADTEAYQDGIPKPEEISDKPVKRGRDPPAVIAPGVAIAAAGVGLLSGSVGVPSAGSDFNNTAAALRL